jgi:hypothetical protein
MSSINHVFELIKVGRFDYLSSKIEDKLLHGNSREKMKFNHHIPQGLPKEDWDIISHVEPTTQDIAIAERLLTAYTKAIKDSILGKPKQDVWGELKKGQHNKFITLLNKSEPKELAEYLCNMAGRGATNGVLQGYEFDNEDEIRRRVAYIKDKLVALGEAVGAIPPENPEQGAWGENIYLDADKVATKIEKIMGISITSLPGDGGMLKLRTKKGLLFQEREIFCLYSAWLIHKLNAKHICEIGAGVARTAYYCHKFGIMDYTMIDLPHMNVLQGFYILKNLPEAKVYLYGETIDAQDSIKIYPDWFFSTINTKQFDLVHNQDSFPEIDKHIVLDYLQQIKKNTTSYFLNINHESRPSMNIKNSDKCENNVPELIKITKGYKLLSRHLYWLRPGYTEELYEINGDLI